MASVRFVVIVLSSVALLAACGGSQNQENASADAQRSHRATDMTCGQNDANAQFGDVQRGGLVRLHKQVEDDVPANWNPDMSFYVDQVTQVTDLLGVDANGCPGVRVEADAGVFFWRVRDLEHVAKSSDALRCGQNELTADYAGLQKGTRITIEQGTPWVERLNWTTDMDAYVGQDAAVTSLSGVDEAGCPGVTLDIDDGVFFWRVRDLKQK